MNWVELKHAVRADIEARGLRQPRIRLGALDSIEALFAKEFPRFRDDVLQIADQKISAVAERLARRKHNRTLNGAEKSVLNDIFRYLSRATKGDTAQHALPTGEAAVGSLDGDKLYQERARAALPVLVRQARAAQTITYGQLAAELNLSNARTLNYPLGAIGNALLELSEAWGEKVPPIQAIVVNKADGLPGEGISWFAPDAAQFKDASKRHRRLIVDRMLAEVYSYGRWGEVLGHFGLSPLPPALHELPPVDAVFRTGEGGEGENHRRLKEAVAADPSLVGLPRSYAPGSLEVLLYSGDRIDVLFEAPAESVAVEVKPGGAPAPDLVRGVFQCVKYRSVVLAQHAIEDRDQDCRAILAVGDRLPPALASLCTTLGVEVHDQLIT